jgi:hypothetical protein
MSISLALQPGLCKPFRHSPLIYSAINMARSESLLTMVGANMDDFRPGVDMVLNFLKYVDRHDVCPEYADDIKNAQTVCLRALDEIPSIDELHKLVPGHLNTALRVLHVNSEEDVSPNYYSETLPDPKQARISHAATLSILMGPSRFSTDIEWIVTETIELTYEILAITVPNDTTRAKYKAINQHLVDLPDIQTCGTVTARPVIVRDGWDKSASAAIPAKADVDTQFILEEDILRLLRVGMKLTMSVCTLNVGLKFIKYVGAIRPSFYVFLPQELMFHYRKPISNDRPAPSIHDSVYEDDGLAGSPVGDQDK